MLDFLASELKLQRQSLAMRRTPTSFFGGIALAASLLAGPVAAQVTDWNLYNATPFPERPYKSEDEGALAANGLPDGHVAFAGRSTDIRSAWYDQPTTRYGHGILGDAIEAGRLVVTTSKGKTLSYQLSENQVFEDRTPRLNDLSNYGKTNVITILSDVAKGASIAVFGIEQGELKLLAQTPFIGLSNRWLNIAGIADFDGDGKKQIAAVWTPHIGGTLKFWTWQGGALELGAEANSFSNHVIGSPEQRLSMVGDFNGDGKADLALPSADRKTLRFVQIIEGQVEDFYNVGLNSPIDKQIIGKQINGSFGLVFGLEDGTVYKFFKNR